MYLFFIYNKILVDNFILGLWKGFVDIIDYFFYKKVNVLLNIYLILVKYGLFYLYYFFFNVIMKVILV